MATCPMCGHSYRAEWFGRWLRVMFRMKPARYVCQTPAASTAVTGWGEADICGCDDPFHTPAQRGE